MADIAKVINRTAVREAFHARGARVPQGFLEDLEIAVMVVLRRASAGGIDPGPVMNPAEAPPGASDREKALREKFMTGGCVYLKESLLKEALREALGKDRIETAWVAHVSTLICLKVNDAVGRRASGSTPAVPSSLLRFFMRSLEAKTMRVDAFLSKCKDPDFLGAWERRLEASKAEAAK
jgi:hypothetical protein